MSLQTLGNVARASMVLGTHLNDHVAGTATQAVLGEILNDVLQTRRSFRMDYRCDAPDQRRDLRFTVTALRDNRVMLTHDLLDAQRLSPIGTGWRWKEGAEVCKCSFCCRLLRDGVWLDPFQSGLPHPEEVDFTVCPDCRATIDTERTRMRKAGRAT